MADVAILCALVTRRFRQPCHWFRNDCKGCPVRYTKDVGVWSRVMSREDVLMSRNEYVSTAVTRLELRILASGEDGGLFLDIWKISG